MDRITDFAVDHGIGLMYAVCGADVYRVDLLHGHRGPGTGVSEGATSSQVSPVCTLLYRHMAQRERLQTAIWLLSGGRLLILFTDSLTGKRTLHVLYTATGHLTSLSAATAAMEKEVRSVHVETVQGRDLILLGCATKQFVELCL